MLPLMKFTLSLVLAQIILCHAAIFSDVKRIRQKYDFVIVGAGPGGLTVANRLTEKNFDVLVLEAGGSHSHDLNITVPFFWTRAAPSTMYDWNYTTVGQVNANNRSLAYPRGYLLGGSSSINSMIYTRGTKDDYDRYASLSGDEGWCWKAMQHYFFKNEKFTPLSNARNTTSEINSRLHGHQGINSDTLPGFGFPLDDMIIDVTTELPEFPFNIDLNGPSHIGIGWKLSTILNGARSSSAISYLAPRFSSRKNLDVLIGARVTKLLPDKKRHGHTSTPSFDAVEFMANGELCNVKASKEIVLSAGAVNTPAILLHTGIGDSAELKALGIKPTVNLPSVGKNLTDHPLARVAWTVNSTSTYEQFTRNATRLAEAQKQWNETRTGILVGTMTNLLGFFRIPSVDKDEDPAAGPDTGHIELLFSNGAVGTPPPEGNFMTVTVGLVTPSSRGSVTINSTNPLNPPLIDPNFLSTQFDRRVFREGIRLSSRFSEAAVFKDYIIAPLSNLTTDDQVDEYAKANVGTIFHPVGTAAMSPKGADHGVVDPDLRVKGVKGLRIVDASVFPRIPAGHTQVPVYAFAERASDLIKQTWR